MGITGLGGGIMVLLAAGLWLVYLMPSMFKRREYVAVERTQVRRQQALRVLQETAPIPAVVRAKAIVSPDGEVTDRDKLAEAIKRSSDAQVAREASRRFAVASAGPGHAASARARTLRRLRRTRSIAALVLLASVATLVVQVVLMISTGVAPAAWGILGFSAVVGVISVAALGRLASMARRRTVVPVAVPVARPVRTRVVEEPEVVRPPVATWTPVAIPKPVYLSRTEAPAKPVAPSAEDPQLQLLAAAVEADRALRKAQESREVTPIPQRPVEAPSRFATMGIVVGDEAAAPDIDEVLRRRRRSA
jgi:hypothetical protein